MNHDYEHCLDYNIDCPEECFRGQLVKDLKSSNQCMEVSWMSFEGTDECMKDKNHEQEKNIKRCSDRKRNCLEPQYKNDWQRNEL